MALQALKGGMWYPEKFKTDGANPILALQLNAAGETAGAVVMAPFTGNIVAVVYSLMGVAVTSGPLNFDARLESVDTSTGLNSGTLLGTNSNGTDSIADSDDNDQRKVTLTTAVAVTKGVTPIAFVLQAPGSGTFDVNLLTLGGDFSGKIPYCLSNGAKVIRVPAVGFEYDDGSYHAAPGCFPAELLATTTFNSSSNPDELGNTIAAPGPCRIDAVYVYGDPTAGGSLTIKITDGSGVERMSFSIDTDLHIDQSDGSMEIPLPDPASPGDLDFDNAEDIVVTVVPDANNFEIVYADVESAAYMDMFDGGQDVHGVTRNNGTGGFTPQTTRRYFVSVRICAIDDGAGGAGGGLITHPGMGGGLL
jgi:hypothetical protein